MKCPNYQKIILTICCFFSMIVISAQTIRGKVVDSEGEALPFVNVIEKSTKNGTTTDDNGEFSLQLDLKHWKKRSKIRII